MNHENDTAKGRAFEKSFTVATALLMKALAGLHSPADNPSQRDAIFEDLDQALLTMGQAYREAAEDQPRPHLEDHLALLGDMIQMAKLTHPAATLQDAVDELSYMTKLMKRSQKDGP